MRIGSLTLFDKCIAAWHWPWSITWWWALYLHSRKKFSRFGLFWHPIYSGKGVICGLNTLLGGIVLHVQPNIARAEPQER